ncbi:MAG: polysaccharide biosynthesis/export family protein [Chthoniobacteraceae bacterium]
MKSYFLLCCLSLSLLIQPLPATAQTDAGGASSSSSSGSAPATATTVSPITGTTIATSPNYVLSPNDLLDIKVHDEEDLRTIVRIPQDGLITFPLIGVIKVGGRSVSDATEYIRSRLQADYLVNPQVNLTITEYAKRHFTIIGQVQRPGAYDIPDEQQIDLLDAIAMAGGYTRIANASSISLKRKVDGKDVVYHLNANKMAKLKGQEIFKVQEGDTIVVAESIF